MGLAEFCGAGDLGGPKCTCYMIEQNSLFLEEVLRPETPLRHPLSPPTLPLPHYSGLLPPDPLLSKIPQGGVS